jgi:hypothetical protein
MPYSCRLMPFFCHVPYHLPTALLYSPSFLAFIYDFSRPWPCFCKISRRFYFFQLHLYLSCPFPAVPPFLAMFLPFSVFFPQFSLLLAIIFQDSCPFLSFFCNILLFFLCFVNTYFHCFPPFLSIFPAFHISIRYVQHAHLCLFLCILDFNSVFFLQCLDHFALLISYSCLDLHVLIMQYPYHLFPSLIFGPLMPPTALFLPIFSCIFLPVGTFCLPMPYSCYQSVFSFDIPHQFYKYIFINPSFISFVFLYIFNIVLSLGNVQSAAFSF